MSRRVTVLCHGCGARRRVAKWPVWCDCAPKAPFRMAPASIDRSVRASLGAVARPAQARAGQEPLVRGEASVIVTVRLTGAHVERLGQLVADGYAPDRSAAIRRAVEQARI